MAGGGVTYIDAPGNYDATGAATIGFLVNGLQLGTSTSTGAGAYALNPSNGASLPFATFDSTWLGSGLVSATTDAVALVGYYGVAPTAGNYVRAVTQSTYGGTLPFPLAPEVLVASPSATEDVLDLAAAGSSAMVAMGSFDSNFIAHVSHVDQIPPTVTGSGIQTVTVGTPVRLLNTTDTCTNVLFIQRNGARLLVGLEDKNGRRLLDLQP